MKAVDVGPVPKDSLLKSEHVCNVILLVGHASPQPWTVVNHAHQL